MGDLTMLVYTTNPWHLVLFGYAWGMVTALSLVVYGATRRRP